MQTQDNANLFFDTPPAFFNDTVKIAFGKNKEDRFFKNEEMSYGKLLTYLCQFQRGPKNGQCMTQGSQVDGVGSRLSVHQDTQAVVLIDVDNGTPLETIDATLAEHNLHAVLYTTHSHGKGESAVPEKKMVAYQKEQKAERIDLPLIVKYFREEKGYDPAILATASNYRKKQQDGGVHCVIDHAPMPRYRVLFKLKDPYKFVTNEATQQERITEWKERYAGVCRALRIPYDTSCVDPSRLMFLPRIANDALVCTGAGPTAAPDENGVVGGHGIYVFDGDELDLTKFERYVSKKGSRAAPEDQFTAFAAMGPKRDGTQNFATANLVAFAAKYPDFEAGACCNELALDDEFVREVGEGKFELTCPTADLHSEPDAPGMSRFFVQSANGDNSWVMHCQGDTCKRASEGDRLVYLDKWCQAHSIVDAMCETLLRYCPKWHDEQEEKKKVSAAAAVKSSPDAQAQLKALIDVELTKMQETKTATDQKTIGDVCKGLARVTDGEYVIAARSVIHRLTLTPMGTIRELIKTEVNALKKAEKAVKERTEAESEEARAAERLAQIAAQRAARRSGKPVISTSEMGVDERRAAVVKAVKAANMKRPHIFAKDGMVVRVMKTVEDPNRLAFKVMDREAWKFEEMEACIFCSENMRGEEVEGEPPPECTNALMGTTLNDWPVIDFISTVPLFGADGQFYDQEGYHPDIRAYIKPNIQCLDIPDVIDDEAVTWARNKLLDAISDLPFSDVFNGDDPEPIKHNDYYDLAETGGRVVRRQNFKRGRSSRATAVALTISPHTHAIFQGKAPAFLISKTEAGTGAGTLMDIVHIIAEGHGATARPVSPQQEEFRKQITTALMSQKPIIFLDNINHYLDSPEFAGALTTGTWGDRMLGTNTSADIRVACTWVLSGNGIRLSRELMRRMLPIHMDANDPNPALNRGDDHFKYDPVELHIEAFRPVYLQAIHILIKNWFQKGCPKGSKHINSFHVYTATMGGILEAAGIDGFLGNIRDYIKTEVNDAGDDFQEAVEMLWDKMADKVFDIDDAWDALKMALAEPSGKENLCVDVLPRDRSSSLRNTRGLAKSFHSRFVNKNYKVAEEKIEGGINVKFVKVMEHRRVRYKLVKTKVVDENEPPDVTTSA